MSSAVTQDRGNSHAARDSEARSKLLEEFSFLEFERQRIKPGSRPEKEPEGGARPLILQVPRRTWKLLILVLGLVAFQSWNEFRVGRSEVVQTAKREVSLDGAVSERTGSKHIGETKFEVVLADGERKVLISAPDLPWLPSGTVREGDRIRVLAKERRSWFGEPSGPLSYQAYLKRRGIAGVYQALEVEVVTRGSEKETTRERFLARLASEFGSRDALGVALASTLAESGMLTLADSELFRRTGTTHLLVVSGFHVGVIFLMVHWLSLRIFSRIEAVTSRYPAQIPASLLAVLAVCLYTALVGGAPTTVRSCFVISLFAIGSIFGRKSSTMDTFLLAFLLVIILWPGSFFEAGVQLTFSAILGLLIGATLVQRLIARLQSSRKISRFGLWVMNNLAICLGAWLFTSPVVVLWFGAISPLSPLINFFAVPVFSTVCIGLGGVSFLAYFLHLPASSLLVELNLLAVEWFMTGLEYLDRIAAFFGLGYFSITDRNEWWILAGLSTAIITALAAVACGKPSNSKNSAASLPSLSASDTLPTV